MPRKKDGKFDQVAYQNRYNAENYDRILFSMPKGKKEVIKEAAQSAGKSVNAYILEAVEEKMEGKK